MRKYKEYILDYGNTSLDRQLSLKSQNSIFFDCPT